MIEGLWESLRQASVAVQQRVDATHPLDLYADFQPPDRPGLLLLTSQEPPKRPQVRSISINVGRRLNGRWYIRLTLEAPALHAVFAELCHDIIESTRESVPESAGAVAVLDRLDRWRRLLERGTVGFSMEEARGLLGELAVLRWVVLSDHDPEKAVAAWTGPLQQPHDFLLPSGSRIEVKAIQGAADSVRINGLDQLESGQDPLTLIVVRLEETSPNASGALTVGSLSDLVRAQLSSSAEATDRFDRLLRLTGWNPDEETQPLAARIGGIEGYLVQNDFPRMTASTVPSGVIDASYLIRLPPPDRYWDIKTWNSVTSMET